MSHKKKIPFVLSIAGSDPSSGAGIQSDIKTFHNFNVFGLTAITAITAQNTTGVQNIFHLPPSNVKAQLSSIFNDFDINVAKTGMLCSDKIVNIISQFLIKYKNLKLIVDPVLFSKNNYPLLNQKGIKKMKSNLLPLTYLITPNFYELQILSNTTINSFEGIQLAMQKIYSLGTQNVLLKGGHFNKNLSLPKSTDILFDGKKYTLFYSIYVNTKHTHGIGCVLSSAIASNLALGKSLKESIKISKQYLIKLLLQARKIGKGSSPLEQLPPQ